MFLRRILTGLLLAGLVTTAGSHAGSAGGVEAADLPELDALFTRLTDEWMESDPDSAIEKAYFTGEKQNAIEQQLTPMTREHKLARIALARRGLEELGRLDLDKASVPQRHAATVLRWQLERHVSTERWLDYLKPPLQHYRGAGRQLVTKLTVSHPFIDADDVENYVLRMQWIDDRMREATADSARRAEQGVVMPDFIIDASIAQLQVFVATPAGENPLVTALARKSEGIPGLGPLRRRELLEQATEIVERDIYPAWHAAIAQLQRDRKRATSSAGVSRFKDGVAFYQHRLAYYTSGSLTPDQVHEIGLAEVERISARMLALFEEIGIQEGSIQARVEVLRERLAFSDTPEGRKAMMAELNIHLADARRLAPGLFDQLPRADVVIQPHPEFLWPTAAASYKAPSQDGSRPGIFQMPLRADRLTRFAARSLVFHETIPGHHFQLALLAENPDLPRFLQIRAFGSVAASSEGWALYAEHLAAESGWFEGDPEGLIGQLQAQLFRAKRLVVDTGLHTKGWTRQQAIDYGFSPSEVERYVVRPGQACAYMLGQLQILALRERAREALGDRFSLRQFHDVVLGAGVVPLFMLERVVENYIAARS
jgi:uncharacterized protein (DUF885 family)